MRRNGTRNHNYYKKGIKLMSIEIKKCAVLGAGVMGAQIAGHIANAGIPSLLFDINLSLIHI